MRELGAGGEGQLQVELVAWPLRQLEAWRTRVGQWADALAGVDAIDAQGNVLQVNLLPPAQLNCGQTRCGAGTCCWQRHPS